ncbi:MAG: Asp-tRNA(Asn)/Glu-tRNA(Gln) amidotransferase subunit GatB [Oscillospiraceae bacterium]|nr:Asp-tRNA(Asn)/Glu-tRNA(Gln) amidotransferase subunit GatB [Oscillospiraceae bacterium]
MKWETIVGLEVHVELSTKSKIFCACTTAFGGAPNTHVCPVCAGMPGALPTLNRSVVACALRVGVTLGCAITRYSKFDRKNYFYPDLPKAYQISQLYAPICRDGHLDIVAAGRKKTIGIREIHMEEDAGKLIHDPGSGNTFMDYNRCGVPLLEIVTTPDFRDADEVLAFLDLLRETLLYLDVSDGKMQEGSLRADVNLSVRPEGGALGIRTEMKNLNSFKAIARAIAFESARQIKVLKLGGVVTQETRRWDDDAGVSLGMRSKEDAQDYRYFPEPDLLPIVIDDPWLREIKDGIPELAQQKRRRYIDELGLSEPHAAAITAHKNIAGLFESVSKKSGQPLEAANLITGAIMHMLNQSGTLPENLLIDADKLSFLILLVAEGKINRSAYKEAVEAVFLHNVDPEAYVTERGLLMISDGHLIAETVRDVLAQNQSAAADYHAGRTKAFGFLMGQAMRRGGRSCDPDTVKKALTEALQRWVPIG